MPKKKLKRGHLRLYRNKFKEAGKTKANAPDFIGSLVDMAGEEYYISCWVITREDGKKYMSGMIENKKELDDMRSDKRNINKLNNILK
jgi:hypothetical protein